MQTLFYRANAKRDKQYVLQEARARIEVILLSIRFNERYEEVSVKKLVKIYKNPATHAIDLQLFYKKNEAHKRREKILAKAFSH